MPDAPPPAPAGSGFAFPARGAAIPVVHAVTDDLVITGAQFAERALAVMQALGPRGAVHLRARIVPARRLFTIAEALRLAQDATGCWLVVNDRLDIARASGAAAVQLTSHSIRVADARRVVPTLPLGASVHTPDEAAAAGGDGADWVVAGHVFRTASHPGAPGRGIPFVQRVRAATALPVLAIGGVTVDRVGDLRAAGADGVAVIRGIWGARDAERAATGYLTAYDAHGSDEHDPGHGER